MIELKQVALNRVLNTLTNMGCKFAVIDEDGKTYGDLEIVQPRTRSKSKYEHGALTAYLRQWMDNMTPGEVVVIPIGDFDCKSLSSALSAYANRMWGKEAHTYMTRGNNFELLRIL